MSCTTCLARRDVARDLFPWRRPLFVRCGACRRRWSARLHIVVRASLLMLTVVVAVIAFGWTVGALLRMVRG